MSSIPIAAPITVGLVATGLLAWLVVQYSRRSRSPAERERRRRIHLHINGRLTEVTVFHADESIIHYGYEIAGVAYDATQDISALSSHLPVPAGQLVGTSVAKYDPQNPANSIVLSEHWHGFKERHTNR